MESEIKHECGVFGAIGSPNCLEECLAGLNALQHRGEEQCGVASWQNGEIVLYKHAGLVNSIFSSTRASLYEGEPIATHNRYSTAGASNIENAQPHLSFDAQTALCSNGDLPPESYRKWRLVATEKGFEPQTDNDGELLLRLVEWQLQEGHTIELALEFLQKYVYGSFSALVIHGGNLIAFRDRYGFRPLVFGARKDGSRFVASETCALDEVGVNWWRAVAPGEILTIYPDGSCKQRLLERIQHAHCIFEDIYFGFVTSTIFGIPVDPFRARLGELLARTMPPNADLVIAVPDSSNSAAVGLANASGVRFAHGLVRRHHQGRSFTAPHQAMRNQIVETKLVANRDVVSGKRLVVADDSLVRGTTAKIIVGKLFEAGAKEVHLRFTAPPITDPCYYGINTPDKSKLVASHMTIDQIREMVGADSLVYLGVDDLKEAIRSFGRNPDDYCFACFTGNYPPPLS